MLFDRCLNGSDAALLAGATENFLPRRVFDIHAHVSHPDFYQRCNLPALLSNVKYDAACHRDDMALLLGTGRVEGSLFFGFPSRDNDRPGVNGWLLSELRQPHRESHDRGLVLAAPSDDRDEVERLLGSGHFSGIKPYHIYAGPADTTQANIQDFTPEWMWQACHQHKGILMLHLVKDAAVSDPNNRRALRELCEKYPDCRVVLAHVARAFNYRTARGLKDVSMLPNVFVDTSAVTEAEAIRTAIEILGIERVLYGSDYPISHVRGRCVSTGLTFRWLYADEQSRNDMTLVGIESLLCLREAAESLHLTAPEIERIFYHNAVELLGNRTPGPDGGAVAALTE